MIPASHYGRKKMTATEFAKRMVLDYGEGALFWQERIDPDDLERVTDSESELISKAVMKQWQRVRKFLGLE